MKVHSRTTRGEGERFYLYAPSSRHPLTNRIMYVQLTGGEAEALEERAERMIRNGTLPPARLKITFREYGGILQKRRRRRTAEGKDSTALKDMTDLFGDRMVIESCKAETVGEMIRQLDQSGLSLGRKKGVWNLIRAIGADCRKRHLIEVDYFSTKKIRRMERKEIEVLDPEEAGILLRAGEQRVEPADECLSILLSGGVRVGEGIAMTAESVSEDGRKAEIRRQIVEKKEGKERIFVVKEYTKTMRNRSIDLVSTGAKIAQWRRAQVMAEKEEKSGHGVIPGKHLLFSENGQPLSRAKLRQRFRELLRGHQHEDSPLGILRRTGLTIYYRSTGSRLGVQNQSGDTWNVLVKHYLRVEKEELRRLAARYSKELEALINGREGQGKVANAGGLGGALVGYS